MPINFSSKKTFIRKLIIKENESHFLIIGTYNIKKSIISYLQIKKLEFNKNNYKEYSSYKLKDILDELNIESSNSNKHFEDILDAKEKPLNSIKEINCLFGFIKFNMGYYAIFSCDSEIIGKIGRNIIYRVDRLYYFSLFDVDEEFKLSSEYLQETKYLNLVTSISYDKQLYFSYSYDLTKTLQRNFVESFKKEMIPGFETNIYMSHSDIENIFEINKSDKLKNNLFFKSTPEKNEKNNKNLNLSLKRYTNYYFCWNYFHIKEFFNLVKNRAWINFFIYGYFGQTVCNIKGLRLLVSVIARRNRHYAGMRYLKRGISDDGNVANDVETEQILEEINTTWTDRPKLSSFIQIRGSIPIYWYQNQSAFYLKPIININLSDIKFEATKRHFASLLERYGHPCIVCNLTKKNEDGKPQETLLNEWYLHGVNYVNNQIDEHLEKIYYYQYDLKNERNKKNFYKQYYITCSKLIDKINLFLFMPNLKNKYHISLQNGVVRTNCIDCLDRTNVFQQILGIAVMVLQLKHLGFNEKFPENKNENIYGVLTELYIKMGHELSNQYTGSLALKQTITDERNFIDKMIGSVNEIIIACKRNVMNYFSDQPKQNAMNLFLGKYPINAGLPYIWDMPSDEILHKKKNLKKLSKHWYEENYNRFIIFNLFSDIDKNYKLQNNGKIIFIKNFKKKNKDDFNMSTTSLFIHKDLCSKNSNDSILPRQSSHKVKTNESNKKNSNNTFSFIDLNENINEYILDYNYYIEFKEKKQFKDEEEKAFEEDSSIYFLLEVKNLDSRDFNNFEYYPANFIKKNGINNNINEEIDQNSNNNITSYNLKQYRQNFEDLRHIKTNSNLRKSYHIKFNTPIKNKFSKFKNYKYTNETKGPKQFEDKHGTVFVHYTPFVTNLTSNFNSKFSSNNIAQYCTNPRNVTELKNDMIILNTSSFQFNDEDYNKINNFTQPIDKQLKKKDLYELDPFNTCDLENTEGIYEIHKHIEKDIIEFDPFQSLVLEEQKKEEIDNEDEDYIIFDVKKKKFFKKCHHDMKKTNLLPIKDFFPDIGYVKKEENKVEENNGEEEKINLGKELINKDDKNKIKNNEEENQLNSPKIRIDKIQQLPLKIEDDFFMLK